jgi:hypothetical protein
MREIYLNFFFGVREGGYFESLGEYETIMVYVLPLMERWEQPGVTWRRIKGYDSNETKSK